MKNSLIVWMTLVSMSSFAQFPRFTTDKSGHNFQDTKEGVVLSHIFIITNTGDIPLMITDYKVACPCTKVELPINPILPGQVYKMNVTFDTKGKRGFQDRSILLQTNTKKREEKLRIKVFVIPEED